MDTEDGSPFSHEAGVSIAVDENYACKLDGGIDDYPELRTKVSKQFLKKVVKVDVAM